MSAPTSADLALVSGQILDKLSDLVQGPVQGTLLATSSAGTVKVLQGQLATLPDGRIVRVRKTKKVSTTPTPVLVRLLYLTPAYPAAGNTAGVSDGVTATWISPPTGLTATATVSGAFTANATTLPSGAALACLGSVAEFSQLREPDDLFAAGAQGSIAAVLQESDVARASFGQFLRRRHETYALTWRLRVNFASLVGEKQRRVSARDVFDALNAALNGARVGSLEVTVNAWREAPKGKTAQALAARELVFTVYAVVDGRSQQPNAAPAFADINVSATINDSTTAPAQPTPYTVTTDATST